MEQWKESSERRKKTPVKVVTEPIAGSINLLEIGVVAESFGAVDISNVGKGYGASSKGNATKKKKWTRRKS